MNTMESRPTTPEKEHVTGLNNEEEKLLAKLLKKEIFGLQAEMTDTVEIPKKDELASRIKEEEALLARLIPANEHEQIVYYTEEKDRVGDFRHREDAYRPEDVPS